MPTESELRLWARVLADAGLADARVPPSGAELEGLRLRAGLTKDQVQALEVAALRAAMRGGAALGGGRPSEANAALRHAEQILPWHPEVRALAAALGHDRGAISAPAPASPQEGRAGAMADAAEAQDLREWFTDAPTGEARALGGPATPRPSAHDVSEWADDDAGPASEPVAFSPLRSLVVLAAISLAGLVFTVSNVLDKSANQRALLSELAGAGAAEAALDETTVLTAPPTEAELRRAREAHLVVVPMSLERVMPPARGPAPDGGNARDVDVHVVAEAHPDLALDLARGRATLRGASRPRLRLQLRMVNRGDAALTKVQAELIARDEAGDVLQVDEVGLLGPVTPPIQPGDGFVWGVPAQGLPAQTADVVIRVVEVVSEAAQRVEEAPACVRVGADAALASEVEVAHLQTLSQPGMRRDDFRVTWRGSEPLRQLVLVALPVDARGDVLVDEPSIIAKRNVSTSWRPPMLPMEARFTRVVHFLSREQQARVREVCLEVTEIEALDDVPTP